MRRTLRSVVYRSRALLTRWLGKLQSWESQLAQLDVASRTTQAAPGTPDLPELDVGILVTTFEERQFQYCLPLVQDLRQRGPLWPIVVVINGSPSSGVDDDQRRKLIRELSHIPLVFPIGLRQMVGLARLWNLGIQVLNTATTVVLNDDLHVVSDKVLEDLSNLALAAADQGLVVGNGSWSHYAITRETLREIGWFDERFLGFGEEDGDFSWRYRSVKGAYPASIPIRGIVNAKANSHQSNQTTGSKYSLVNRVWSELNYPRTGAGGIEIEPPPQAVSPTPDLYPGETVRDDLGHLLWEPDEQVIRAGFGAKLGPFTELSP